jgi:hypothetical protein
MAFYGDNFTLYVVNLWSPYARRSVISWRLIFLHTGTKHCILHHIKETGVSKLQITRSRMHSAISSAASVVTFHWRGIKLIVFQAVRTEQNK